ncbi:MAG: hypothetical protein V1787_00365 [Candidatus Micrarchaeota archaeon]
MVNVTVSVPEDFKKELDRRAEINWSEVARQAWKSKLDQLELLDSLTAKSKATDEDIEELGRMLRKNMADRHKKA